MISKNAFKHNFIEQIFPFLSMDANKLSFKAYIFGENHEVFAYHQTKTLVRTKYIESRT